MNHPFLLWLLITCGAIAFMVGIVFVIAAAVAWSYDLTDCLACLGRTK